MVKVVIQCAASKVADAGYMKNPEGTPIRFIDDPKSSPRSDVYIDLNPHDMITKNHSGLDILIRYNRDLYYANPFKLKKAYELYRSGVYRDLVDKLGVENVYILSAGWGLVRSDFLLPVYDITFSISAESYKRRSLRSKKYKDLNQLNLNDNADLYFFGGKSYYDLFVGMTKDYSGSVNIFYNSKEKPQIKNCNLIHYDSTTKTNWHYKAAKEWLNNIK